jgi:hypothetical protein
LQQKFYKLLIIGNLQPTILHIQTRGVGGLGRWGDGLIGYLAVKFCHFLAKNNFLNIEQGITNEE